MHPTLTPHPRARRRTALRAAAAAATGWALNALARTDTPDAAATAASAPATPADHPFGPDVHVFDPDTPPAHIQQVADDLFRAMEQDHFSRRRTALLFKPGTYRVRLPVGFFTQVSGLGLQPDNVTLQGGLHCDADWMKHNATINFWRLAENLAVEPAGGRMQWAVSQAAPLRRVHIRGDLWLEDGHWSSGGLLADSIVDGNVDAGGQQQWLTRHSRIGGFAGTGWNLVFVATEGAPDGSRWPEPAWTSLPAGPGRLREKPFVVWTAAGWGVHVPALRQDAHGPSWGPGRTPSGRTLPISAFHIARPGQDDAASLNAALAAGRHLLLTPGIYRLDAPLRVARAGSIVLGLGLATLESTAGQPLLLVGDIPGAIIAGLLLDAGAQASPVLAQIGPPGARGRHPRNPVSLHDLFTRNGGGGTGRCGTHVEVHAHHVIGDHLWLWRADHGEGVGWALNTSTHGLVVQGDDVDMLGLFNEHHMGYQTLWNGERGRTWFYQSETPYEVPAQAAWMDGAREGFASYKVAAHVRQHEAWCLGVYAYFPVNKATRLHAAVEAPEGPGIRIRRITTLSLGGNGEISHPLNAQGEAAREGHVVARLAGPPIKQKGP